MLAGLIRLAYFNVTGGAASEGTEEVRKNCTGLPITASALIFPLFYSISLGLLPLHGGDHALRPPVYAGGISARSSVLMALTGILYITPFKMESRAQGSFG